MKPVSEPTILELVRIFRAFYDVKIDEMRWEQTVRYFNRPAVCVIAALLENPYGMTKEELHEQTGYALRSIDPALARASDLLEKAGKRLIQREERYVIGM